MKLVSKDWLQKSGLRRLALRLMAGAALAGLITAPVGAQMRPANPRFTLASLEGTYAYENSVSNVASYAVVRFDGRGGLTVNEMRVNKECLSCEGRREITSLVNGIGQYAMKADGTGEFFVTYYGGPASPSRGPDPTYWYEFVVTNAVEVAGGKHLAIKLFAAGRTGGLAGQLFAPTLTRQVVPESNDRR